MEKNESPETKVRRIEGMQREGTELGNGGGRGNSWEGEQLV